MNKKIKNATNLYIKGIKKGFIEFFSDFVKRCPIRDIKIIRKLVDGRYVFLQAYHDINNGKAKWVTTEGNLYQKLTLTAASFKF